MSVHTLTLIIPYQPGISKGPGGHKKALNPMPSLMSNRQARKFSGNAGLTVQSWPAHCCQLQGMASLEVGWFDGGSTEQRGVEEKFGSFPELASYTTVTFRADWFSDMCLPF